MSMITVDGSAADLELKNDEIISPLISSEDSYSQKEVIQKFMESLEKSTKTTSTEMLDEAIQACSNFNGIDDAVANFLHDASVASDGSDFLTNYCGIILGNTDTGAITGSDAGGTSVKSAVDIVSEIGSLNTNFTDTSFTSNGLTITLGSNVTYDSAGNQTGGTALSISTLSDSYKTIWQALKTWWMDASLELITESYGANYGFGTASSATVKNMPVNFTTTKSGDSMHSALAWVTSSWDSSGKTTSLSLTVNMYYYNTITSSGISSNKDGDSGSMGSLYLDRVIAHEFTHAVMAANINKFAYLPTWIKEGMAELTHGIDDVRGSISTLASTPSALSSVVQSKSTVSSSYTSDYAYSGGYMFLRWLAKNYNAGDVLYGTEYNDNDTKQGKGKNKKLYSSLTNTGNNKTIYALAGNDKITNSGDYVTVVGGTGKDTINLNGSSETVVYSSGDGKDVLIGFGASDSISIGAGAITTSSLKKNNVILKIGKGTITLNDAKGQLINVIDADGNLSTKMYGKGTVTVQGFSTAETVTGWSKADSLNGADGNDTLVGGKGADTLTGGLGADVFFYSKGDGKDVITDYTAGEDVIILDDAKVTKAAAVKKSPTDITFTVTKGSIRVNNGVGNRITFVDAITSNTLLSQTFGTDYMQVTNADFATINTAIDAAVLTVDASARTTDVMLIGNSKANYIKLGTGNETITTGKGKDTIEYFGGDATITDYTAGSDVIKFNNSEIVSAKLNSNNEVVFTLKDTGTTTATTTLTLQNMVKKKKVQKVTVIDKDGITYAQTFGSPTLTVGNSDGDTVVANSDVTVMNAAKRTKSVYLVGNEYNGTIKGSTKADTIEAGLGNDYVTGGKGNDVFIFSGGCDTIGDYSVTSKNSDQITLSSVAYDTYYVDGKNVIMTFKDASGTSLQESDTSLTIVNGKDKSITINGAARVYNDYYEKIFAKKDGTSTYNAAGTDDSLHTVKLIDASKKTSSIYITGNNFSDGTISTIKGGTKADTLRGGIGNDILTGGKGADLFIYAGGNDTITDYTAGTDIISFSDTNLISAKYNGNDLEFTTDKGILTVQKAIKKNKAQKMTILDLSSKVSTAQIYGRTELTIGAKDGDTLDLSRSVNSDVTKVSASGRSKTAPITIIGNTKADNLTGSKGDDTIILSTDTGRGKATITYTAGNDKITNWKADDALNLSNGQSLATATRVSDTNYKITVNKSKKAVGTLDISGTFTTSLGTSATYKGTGTDTDTYYDITSYVNIGGTNVAYDVQSKIKVTSAAYMERFDEYLEDVQIFDDTILSTAYELEDIASTNVKDNVISIDYDSPLKDVTIVELDISGCIDKVDKNKS